MEETAPALPAFLHTVPQHRSKFYSAFVELCAFGWKEAWSCLFAGLIFLFLGVTKVYGIPGVERYDLLLALCIVVQLAMLKSGMETRDELKVICVFHLLGLMLELWKVHIGSWSYPGNALTKVGGVPLFGGFMYASVASYICQAWRRLELQFHNWPTTPICVLIGAAIYINFFTNYKLPDIRWYLFAAIFWIFRSSYVTFLTNGPTRRMPMLLAFLLIAFFIWFAENAATFLSAWHYPHQHHGWKPVYLQKLSSWFLLVIVSIIIVAELKRAKARQGGKPVVFSKT
jgi:uncharacterized membrane protein YoaT (DUF817 family)